MTEHRKGQLLVLAASVLWSIGGALAKLIALPGPTMACYRALFAALTLLPMLILGRHRISFAPAMALMALSFTAMNVTYVTAITKTTAANAIFLQYTAPVWMTLGSIFWLKEPPERKSLLGLFCGMVGVALILVGRQPEDTLGTILGLTAGLFYAGVVLCLRRLRDHDPIWLTFLNHAVAGIAGLGLLAALPALGPIAVDVPRLGGLVFYGAVQMAIPYVVFSAGLKRITPQEAGVLSLVEPLLNPVITYATVGEVPSGWTIAGGGAILAGVAVRYVGPDDAASRPRHSRVPASRTTPPLKSEIKNPTEKPGGR